MILFAFASIGILILLLNEAINKHFNRIAVQEQRANNKKFIIANSKIKREPTKNDLIWQKQIEASKEANRRK